MRDTLPDRVRLGVFEVDLRAGEVCDGERRIILQGQALSILRMLIERDGELIGREEIRKTLWPNDTVVEFDHSINTAMKKLRQALGDSPDEPKYIETIPRRGYRLLVPVQWIEDNVSSADPSESRSAAWLQPEAGLIGRKVSHYRVLDVIGGGGMGMVYKAEDLKLGRRVALKFLPEELAWDPVALQRFQREAEAASSLDHPNICTIFEVEDHDGQPFIVMQLLHGETLRDRLAALAAAQAKLALDELLDIAIQICNGVQAAHKKGIVHRDIKPANIFLTSTGQVKILDFGLAKLISAAEQPGSDGLQLQLDGAAAPQPDRSARVDATLTRLGLAVGTAGYMSPEQVRGEKLDARTDIFSFGLVLYEMATGQRPFTGDTAAVVHDAILNRTPTPPRELNSELSPGFGAVIDKALAKGLEQRYQSAAELGSELQRLKSDKAVGPVDARHRRRRRLLVTASALVLLAAIAIGRLVPRRAGPPPEVKERQLTANPIDDPVMGSAISPDGKYVAYHDETGVYLRSVGSGEIRPIALPVDLRRGILALVWVPGSEKLVAEAVGQDGLDLWLLTVLGEAQPRLLYQGGADPAVSPDGQKIAFVSYGHGAFEQEVLVGSIDGEAPRKLVAAEEFHRVDTPSWSPDAHWIAYAHSWRTAQGAWSSAIEVRPSEGGPAKILLAESGLPKDDAGSPLLLPALSQIWLPDWRLLFVAERGESVPQANYSLWQLPVKPWTEEAAGVPQRVTPWSEFVPLGLSTTADGKRLSFHKDREWDDVYLAELSSDGTSMKPPRRFTLDQRGSVLNAWARDSQAIFFGSARNGRHEIFRQRLNDTVAERIADGYESDISPDGEWLLIDQTESSSAARGSVKRDGGVLMRQPTRGGPPERILELRKGELDNFFCSSKTTASSPCVLSLREGKDLVFYSLDPVRGKGRRLGEIEATHAAWRVSPDGTHVALVDQYVGRIRLLSLADGTWHEVSVPPSIGTLRSVAWAADGGSLFVGSRMERGSELLDVTMAGKVRLLLRSADRKHPFVGVMPSPDGKYLALGRTTYDSNVWMIDNF